ncbi:hypothetical protein AAGV33_14890 [Flavobacterium sp. FBOR7N2.3]|uniref:Outer membrane protein beta-barrel domain-containing protein n=1 Tax=Flavobacterium magnesitis TaxID=3138077 RepID=A0ABV4TNJ7_9FLAO
MIKNYASFIFLLVSTVVFSQEVYFASGKNYTKYNYKDANFQSNPNLQSGTGNFYEVGIVKSLVNKNILYSFGIALNEYNAIGGNSANSYRWDTEYLGLHGALLYQFYTHIVGSKNKIDFLAKARLNAATIIYGKQEINGMYYDLINENEFSGLILESSLGFMAKYQIASFGALSLGYNFGQSVNITNDSREKISFNTNQLQLGFHFNIN